MEGVRAVDSSIRSCVVDSDHHRKLPPSSDDGHKGGLFDHLPLSEIDSSRHLAVWGHQLVYFLRFNPRDRS